MSQVRPPLTKRLKGTSKRELDSMKSIVDGENVSRALIIANISDRSLITFLLLMNGLRSGVARYEFDNGPRGTFDA